MTEYWRFTLTDLYHEIATWYSYVKVGQTSIFNILQNELGMRKGSERWVPCWLAEEHHAQRIGAVLEFLTQYHNERDQYLDRIVTGDETWVPFWIPEMKEKSKIIQTMDEPTPKKFKEVPSASKVIDMVFWD